MPRKKRNQNDEQVDNLDPGDDGGKYVVLYGKVCNILIFSIVNSFFYTLQLH